MDCVGGGAAIDREGSSTIVTRERERQGSGLAVGKKGNKRVKKSSWKVETNRIGSGGGVSVMLQLQN